jgi:plasmid maintenance system antidote protein VapI
MKKSVRHLPAWQVTKRLKGAGIRQVEVARRARVNQGTVSRVIGRDDVTAETAERVWRAIEDALAEREQKAS